MDPYETGYLNWKRYIVGNARILPTPSPEYMRFIKTKLTDCPSFSNGKISKSDFLGVPLWFEDEDDTSYPHDETKLFNRSLKLKSALFRKHYDNKREVICFKSFQFRYLFWAQSSNYQAKYKTSHSIQHASLIRRIMPF